MIVDFRVTLPQKDRITGRPAYMRRYIEIFDYQGVSYTVDELLQSLQEADITRAVLQAEWSHGDYRAMNEAVADIVNAYPDVFVGFAAVDAADGLDAVDELRRSVETLGLKGVNVQPFASGLRANDKLYYPLYLKCLEYGIPVTIHTGINYSFNRTMDFGRPVYVDEVACHFPGLGIVLNHAGWPWVPEAVAVARKHRSVYLEVGGIAPKYLALPGSGWEVLMQFANTLLQDRVLFATDSMIPFKRAVQEARALPLKPEVKEKLLYRNACQLLGIEP
ncbi:MAG: amidohydrolase [Candidatus Rokubacteria bacterium]|nr:amidohydrolase [Candidatus Rokubacteria bacterium]